MYLDKPVALVTGSSRGIGRGIALHLARDGYRIVIHTRAADPSRTDKGAYEVKARIEEEGGCCLICEGDVSRPEDREKIVEFIDKEVGRLDFFVSNAGVEPPAKKILDITSEDLDYVMGINLKGPLFLAQAFAKRMICWQEEKIIPRGRIAFITSTQAYRVSGGPGYCITKAGLHMAIQCFATELGEYGIPVIEVIPGVVLTDMSALHKENIDKKIDSREWTVTPRWGTVDDMGAMLAAIGRGVFDYSTGVSVDVSGGMNIFRL